MDELSTVTRAVAYLLYTSLARGSSLFSARDAHSEFRIPFAEVLVRSFFLSVSFVYSILCALSLTTVIVCAENLYCNDDAQLKQREHSRSRAHVIHVPPVTETPGDFVPDCIQAPRKCSCDHYVSQKRDTMGIFFFNSQIRLCLLQW